MIMSSAVMDMYLNASDSMSFQDVLDVDIKSEIETLLGGHNDFSSSFNFNDLPPLELDDVHDIKWFSANSNISNSSNLTWDFSDDGSISNTNKLVNPNAVMPTISSLAHNIRSPSPHVESHLTFSPNTIRFTPLKQIPTQQQTQVQNSSAVNTVKKDLLTKLDHDLQQTEKSISIKSITKLTSLPITAVKTTNGTSIINAQAITTKGTPTLLTFRNAINRQVNVSQVVTGSLSTLPTIRTVANGSRKLTAVNTANNNKFRIDLDDGSRNHERAFPKPAYSYSCLIAMALKNSRSGSLPVSEIYNFMCRHFPYFLTAPNGWKNSVRHNLSLNKCFEKIEKPTCNGAQRKGCLWAMNPAKISKMDEEVQKWSRKDPGAIRKAMVNPDDLEPLERGELKFTCSYDNEAASFDEQFGGHDSCGSASELSDTVIEEDDDDEAAAAAAAAVANERLTGTSTSHNTSTTAINNRNSEIKDDSVEMLYDEVEETIEQESVEVTSSNIADQMLFSSSTPPPPPTPTQRICVINGSNAFVTFHGKYIKQDQQLQEMGDIEIGSTEVSGDDGQELLKVEMALAQRELMLEFEKKDNNKRRRTFIIKN